MICKSVNGQIFICSKCQKIHVEFGSMAIDYNDSSQLTAFLNYIDEIDSEFWAHRNRTSRYRRKIMIRIPGAEVKMLFTAEELVEIKSLYRNFLSMTLAEAVTVKKPVFDLQNFVAQQLN
jgi:hypothetical protein